MLLIDEIEGTQIFLLLGECMSFSGRKGEVHLHATNATGPILVSARLDEKGSIWLGGWRQVTHPPSKGSITLTPLIRHCDWMCRRAATTTSDRVARAHNEFGQVPVVKHREFLVTGRQLPTYVVPLRWLRTRGKAHQEHKNA